MYEFYSNEAHWDWPKPSPEYPQGSDHRIWDDAAQAIIGDFVMWCPARSAATALQKAGHTVYLYDFVHGPAVSVNWPSGTHNLGAFHGAEVPFVFGDTFELVGGEVDLSRAMSTYWTNMASSGDPNVWRGPVFPPPPPTPATETTTGSGSTMQQHRSLQAIRPAADKFWWVLQRYDCDSQSPTSGTCGGGGGSSSPVKACEAACLADPSCGGFSVTERKGGGGHVAHLKSTQCYENKKMVGDGHALFVLRPYPRPPPPPRVALPHQNCSLYTMSYACFNESEGYKTIAINITAALQPNAGGGSRKNGLRQAPDLNKCCIACSADPNCGSWVVPKESNGTQCILIAKSAGASGSTSHHAKGECVGAQAPAWLPPPSCHNLFKPIPATIALRWNASHIKNHATPKRTVLQGETLASCCSHCYADYADAQSGPCAYWEMSEPQNGTCVMYGATGVSLLHVRNGTAGELPPPTAERRAATRIQPSSPPPSPPTPCAKPQQLPPIKWPKWSPGEATDLGMRFDLCNITRVKDIKKARCDFWHATVDRFWDLEQWIPATSLPQGTTTHSSDVQEQAKMRAAVRAVYAQHVQAAAKLSGQQGM